MTKIQKWIAYGGAIVLSASIIAGVQFSIFVVGIDDISDAYFIPSIAFGWLSIFGLIASVAALIAGILQKSRRLLLFAMLEFFIIAQFFTVAYIIQNSGYYMPEGGPAGPHMKCISWEEMTSHDSSSALCSAAYIPAYNQYLIVVPAQEYINYELGWSLEDGVGYLASLAIHYGFVALPLILALTIPTKRQTYPQKSQNL